MSDFLNLKRLLLKGLYYGLSLSINQRTTGCKAETLVLMPVDIPTSLSGDREKLCQDVTK